MGFTTGVQTAAGSHIKMAVVESPHQWDIQTGDKSIKKEQLRLPLTLDTLVTRMKGDQTTA